MVTGVHVRVEDRRAVSGPRGSSGTVPLPGGALPAYGPRRPGTAVGRHRSSPDPTLLVQPTHRAARPAPHGGRVSFGRASKPAPDSADLAYGRTATASSTETAFLAVVNEFDGDPTTRWTSAYSNDQ